MLSRSNLNRLAAFWRHFPAANAVNLTLIIIGIMLVWLLISNTIENPARYLPSPIQVVLSSFDMIYKGLLPSYFGDTITRLVVGSSIGLALGIPFGLLLGLNRTVADMFYPMMNFFQSVSGIAIFPIVVVWWGNSDKTVLAVILYTSFFPIAFTVLSGVREVPLRYIHAARTLGASRYQIIRDVLLPGSMPHIATGSRLSIGFAWRAVIAGEMLAGREGLGWMIFTGQDADKTSEVILGMVMIGVSWIILDHYLLRPFEADTIERWGLVQR
ncbi:MAG: ABC transporter permease [Rhodospirillaceae bacterium]|nr:ABC transporter permease [Rhodospirillaceae bacterium]MBT7957586.1 ABC transporter permease [Rhodospirillaceae bacterium]